MIRFLLLLLLLPGAEPKTNKTDDLESSKESSPMVEDRVPVTTQTTVESPPPTFRQHKIKEPAPQILPSMDAKLSSLLEKSLLTAPAKVHSVHGERRAVYTSKQNGSPLQTTSMPHTGHSHSTKRPVVSRNGNARELALKKLKSKKAPSPRAMDIKMPTEPGLAETEGLGQALLHEVNVTVQGVGHMHSTVATGSPELSTRAREHQVTPGRTSMTRPLKHGFSESPTENRKIVSVGSPTKPHHSRLLKNKSIIDLPSDLSLRTLAYRNTSSFHVQLPNVVHSSSNVTFPAILPEKETGPSSHIASERLRTSTADAAKAVKSVLGEQRIINSTEKMTLTSQGDRNNDISRPLLFKMLDAHVTGETRAARAEGDSKVILKGHEMDLLKNVPNQSRKSNFSSTAIPVQPDSTTQKLPQMTSARPEADFETQTLHIEKDSSNKALGQVQSDTKPGLGSPIKLRRPGNTSIQIETQTKAGSPVLTTGSPRKGHTHSPAHLSLTSHGKPKQRPQKESENYKTTKPNTSAQPATRQHDASKQLHLGQGPKAQTDPNIKTDKHGPSVTSTEAHKRVHEHSPTTKTGIMLSSMFPPGLHKTTTQTPPVPTTAALLGTHWFGIPMQTEARKINLTQSGIGLINSNTTPHMQGTLSTREHLIQSSMEAKITGNHSVVTERLPEFSTQTFPELAKYSIAGQATDRIPQLVSHTKPVGSGWFTPTISASSELSASSEPELSSVRQPELTTKSHLELSSDGLPELFSKRQLEPSTSRQPEPSTSRQPELFTYSPPEPTTKTQPEISQWSQQGLSTKGQLELTTESQAALSTYSHLEQSKESQSSLSNKSHLELSTESELKITTLNQRERSTHNHFMPFLETQPELFTVSQTEVSTNNQTELSTHKELETSTKSYPDITVKSQLEESENRRTPLNQTAISTNSHVVLYTVELSTRSQLDVTTDTELSTISQTVISTEIQPEHSTDNIPELVTQKHPGSSLPWYWDKSTKSQLALSTQSHQDLTTARNQHELSTQSLPRLYAYNQTESATENHPATTIALQTPPETDLSTEIQPQSATLGRTEQNVETAPSQGTEPYSFTWIYPQLSTFKKSGSLPELATQTASGQTHKTTQSKAQLLTETRPGITTQTQGETHEPTHTTEPTNHNEKIHSTLTHKSRITSTHHGPKWQTELTLEPSATSAKGSETRFTSPTTSVTVEDSHGANFSETAQYERNSSQSPSFTRDSEMNPAWTRKDTSTLTSSVLPATASSFNGITTTEDNMVTGSGQISQDSHTVPLNPSLRMRTTTLTNTLGPVQPGTDRIFIVDEQLPVFKVEAINVTYRMQLNMALSALCDQPDLCQALLLQEVVSFYKAVPGFDRIELQNITLDRTLEYRVHLRVESGSAMSDLLELALSDPTWLFGGSHLPEDSLTSRVRSVAMAEDHADPCTDWLSCPLGFQCLAARSLGARCHSPCHGGFCHNRGICVHRKEQEPECQCPVGRDFWYMGQTCDYRMTHQRLTAIACAIVLFIIACAAAVVYILVRRFQTQILQQKLAQTQSSYRRFSRFDDVPTHFWCPSQTWLTASGSLNSLDNPAFSSSEEVFPLQALGSCVCGCQEGAQKCVQTSPMQPPAGDPPRLETSGSSINDLMIDSGKASDVSVSSWPMEPIHWTPFPILHQLSLQSPFHARRPHSYFEGMELVNTERSWTA
ncbi:hypothetical protein XENTR_v10023897 [Xenopus tropicalis]|uniref:Mucin-12 n=1 Tax=Xenopus tropicalis TaxID=8364 RepID=A0A6I8QJ79_XENTR|nr:mucin-12 [Xenopus tropicalis]KAE8579081.1 hypothetical protein XENTR_v10023897 [Xenopus tropicalis]